MKFLTSSSEDLFDLLERIELDFLKVDEPKLFLSNFMDLTPPPFPDSLPC